MPRIVIETLIDASREEVFNLARNIDFHTKSAAHTKEKAIAGKVSGLIELGESVTWKARHFGVWQTLESKITEFDFPNSFVDEMQRGAFKSFKHIHIFEEENGQTKMIDVFEYVSPCGLLGKLADILFLKSYMIKFLTRRNEIMKDEIENNIMS